MGVVKESSVREVIRDLHSRADMVDYVASMDAMIAANPSGVAAELIVAIRNPPSETLSAVLMLEAYRELLALREEVADLRARLHGEVPIDPRP